MRVRVVLALAKVTTAWLSNAVDDSRTVLVLRPATALSTSVLVSAWASTLVVGGLGICKGKAVIVPPCGPTVGLPLWIGVNSLAATEVRCDSRSGRRYRRPMPLFS